MSIPSRLRALALAASLVPLLVPVPGEALVLRRIQVDGELGDWQGVFFDAANNVVDAPYFDGDPDVQASGMSDLRRFAVTWDEANLYLYFRRSARTSSSSRLPLYVYLDTNYDGWMGAGDWIFALSFKNNSIETVRLYPYVPASTGNPPLDPMPGDGQPVPGHGQDAAGCNAGADASPDKIEFEAAIEWSSLHVAAGSPLHIQLATGLLTNDTEDQRVRTLPGEVQDNAAVLDTGFVGLDLSAGTTASIPTGGTASFAHTLATTGNLPQAIDLRGTASSNARIELVTDPDGDGDPSDGIVLGIDGNGDGDFVDGADFLPPGADSNGNLTPDTGLLLPGSSFGVVARVTPSTAVSILDVTIHARSAVSPAIDRIASDTVFAGNFTLQPARNLAIAPGLDADFVHELCNRAPNDATVNLAATSVLGWPAAVLKDGVPVSAIVLARGACATLVARLAVPISTTPGTTDRVTLLATSTSPPNSAAITSDLRVEPPVGVSPDRTGFAVPGTSVFYPHTLSNATITPRQFRLTAVSPLAAVTFWSDPNGDGNPTDGQPIAVTPILPAFGGALPIVVQIDLAADLAFGTAVATSIIATDRDQTDLSATASDLTTVRLMDTFAADPPAPTSRVFPGCSEVYVAASGLSDGDNYRFRWFDGTGTIVRISPPLEPDGLGLVRDVLDLIDIDPLGTWQVMLELQSGGSWVPVTPGGTAEFEVLGDIRPDGGVIASLATDRRDYPTSGAEMSLTALLGNFSTFDYTRTRIEYLVFDDVDRNHRPDLGEPYLQLSGVPGSYAPGRFTCRSTSLPDIAPGASLLDTTCRDLGPMSFPNSGVWWVEARWKSDCSYVLASRSASINAGCASTSTADAGPDRAVCDGGEVTLGGVPAGPGVTYRWEPADFLDDAASPTPVARPRGRTTYSLSIIDGSDCVASDETVVLVEPRPPVDPGRSATLCRGESVALGGPPVPGRSYRWDPTVGLDDPDRSDPVAQPDVSTTYVLTVTDLVTGCTASDSVVVDVPPAPIADAGPDRAGPGPIGPATCDPSLVYRWSPAAGLDDPNRCRPIASPPTGTVYCLTVQSLAGGCESAPDCVLYGAPNCPNPPAAVAGLRTRRAGTSVALEWSAEPLAAGGYRVYRTGSRAGLALPPGEGTLAALTPPDPGATSATDAGAVAPSAGSTLFYRVVAVCGDGISEGP